MQSKLTYRMYTDYILMGCILTVVVSESLFVSSGNNPFLFPPSSDVVGTLPSQVAITNSATVSSSPQSATDNFATGYSAPPFTYTTSEYLETGCLSSQPAVTNSATRYSTSLSATTNSATGSLAPRFAVNGLAAASSTSQSATTNSATGFSPSQFEINGLAAPPSASQSTATISGTGSSASQFGLSTPSSALRTTGTPTKNIHSPAVPVATDSFAQLFSNSISQSLASLEGLKDFADYELERSRDLFFNYGNSVLINAGIDDPALAEVVSKTVESLEALPSLLYFTATTNTLAKFLSSKGILTEDTAPWLSQKFLDSVNSHAVGVDSSDDLVIAVADGFFEFVSSLGLVPSSEEFVNLFHLFAQELKAESF